MSRDRLSHIHYKMHMLMFPQVVTFECKQYLQQLMISESLMGVYHEGGSCKWQNLDIRCQSWLKIMVCRKENHVFIAKDMFKILFLQVFTSFRNHCLHHQLLHKPHYVLDIADVMLGSISDVDLFMVYLYICLNNFGSFHLPQRFMYRILIRPLPKSINY